jgi:ribosomal protein S8
MNLLLRFTSSFQSAILLKKNYFYTPTSSLIKKILKLFISQGYIYGFSLIEKNTILKIYLKYIENKSLITKIQLLSTMAKKRFYVHNFFFFNKKFLPHWNYYIITTNKGLFFSHDSSFLKKKIGGELLIKIKLIT